MSIVVRHSPISLTTATYDSTSEALEGDTTTVRRSVTAVVDQLIGDLDGSVDLSKNPKHMRGYGK